MMGQLPHPHFRRSLFFELSWSTEYGTQLTLYKMPQENYDTVLFTLSSSLHNAFLSIRHLNPSSGSGLNLDTNMPNG